jgi:DNA-directed RNA polymerase specialized sigma24 family protein
LVRQFPWLNGAVVLSPLVQEGTETLLTFSAGLAQFQLNQVTEPDHGGEGREGAIRAVSPGESVRNAQMPTTMWTTILNARDLKSTDAQAALARLCEVYWFPLYAFVRRSGYSHHDAQDVTQGFFEHLFVQGEWLKNVQKERGKFRTFLLCSLSNFLSNEHLRKHAQKRGGGPHNFVPWDAAEADCSARMNPGQNEDKVSEFDRNWGVALIDRCLTVLKSEYARSGKMTLFEALRPYVTSATPDGFYRECARQLETTEGSLRVARHRLLQRFAEILRAEVSQTVCAPEDVESELRDILRVWSTNAQGED